MTSPAGKAVNWVRPIHDRSASYTRGPDRDAFGTVPVLRLQGVVMAVCALTSTAATTLLRQHSRCQGISLEDLAAQVMGSLEQTQTVLTRPVLDELLNGLAQPAQHTTTGRCPSPRQAPAGSPVLHLIPTGATAMDVRASPARPWPAHGLTRRETQVLSLIGKGLTNRDIAATLFLTVNTVKSYIRTAYQKIGVRRRAEAVRWALEHTAPKTQ